MPLLETIRHVQSRIAAAARRAGRNPEEITLIAVTKTFPADAIREAYAAGLRRFGESKVQEFAGKRDALGDLDGVDWHMIGHLQSNKAGKAVELFSAVDSVDSLRLAEKLNAAATQSQKRLPVLIEINVGGEAAKSGVLRNSKELEELLAAAARLTALDFRGLMTVPPYTEDPEGARPFFRQLRELRDGIAERRIPHVRLDVLSMGMSHDFEIAIEEGSNCVRVGSAIFGERRRR